MSSVDSEDLTKKAIHNFNKNNFKVFRKSWREHQHPQEDWQQFSTRHRVSDIHLIGICKIPHQSCGLVAVILAQQTEICIAKYLLLMEYWQKQIAARAKHPSHHVQPTLSPTTIHKPILLNYLS